MTVNLTLLILGILSNLSSFKAITSRICEITGAGVSLVAAMVAAFLHGWKMEMVLLLVFPAIAIAFHLKIRTVERHRQKHHRLMQPANDVS
jgi:membrane protein implicated in regulation of membrane protease activity